MFYTGGQAGQQGLMDITGWQQMSVPAAAQAVEKSQFADGSNYASNLDLAQVITTAILGGTPDRGADLLGRPDRERRRQRRHRHHPGRPERDPGAARQSHHRTHRRHGQRSRGRDSPRSACPTCGAAAATAHPPTTGAAAAAANSTPARA